MDTVEKVALSTLLIAVVLMAIGGYFQLKMIEEIDIALESQIARIDTLELRQQIFLKPLVQMHAPPSQQFRPYVPNTNRSDR